jgi:NAD(P)-dependent dehydrogenase (short-subunit alcohol dehydrogenase family)
MIIGDLRLTQEAKEFVSRVGRDRIVFQPCDVAKWDQLQKLVSTSEVKYKDVPDVWVAGAGVFEPVRLLAKFSFYVLTHGLRLINIMSLLPTSGSIPRIQDMPRWISTSLIR